MENLPEKNTEGCGPRGPAPFCSAASVVVKFVLRNSTMVQATAVQ